ncbi:MAG: glucokinase [Pseudomonadota bacterium]
MTTEARVLVGDVGGTNVRFAVARVNGSGVPAIDDFSRMPNDDFGSFDEALAAYLSDLDVDQPATALFALAGPVKDRRVALTNRDWTVDAKAIEDTQGFADVRLVNDYAAMARAIPELAAEAFHTLHAGTSASKRAPILVAGPGTGLGMATLVPVGASGWRVLTGEGGHSAFAPQSDIEWALAEALRAKFGYVSRELVLSGSGLDAVHEALCGIHGVAYEQASAADILERAQRGDEICKQICEIRSGSVLETLGDVALINGATGGVVVTGGVAERLVSFLSAPHALARFFERGPMSDYMRPIPVRLLKDGAAPLIGAAALHFEREISA